MRVSLERLLRTGQLGDLTPGMSAEQVHALLGEPDAVGGTSRQHHRPSVWLYGSIELYFRQESPYDFHAVFWDAAEKGPLRLPTRCVIEDWELSPGMALPEVDAWMRRRDIAVVEVDIPPESPTTVLVLSSGVRITFDERERLYALYAAEAGEQK
jgi:hypothetical protein